MRVLQASGHDVMCHLDAQFPLTHRWILKNALAWSRRRIAKIVPQGPDRESILRAAARQRQSEETAARNLQRRALSAIGSEPSQNIVPTNNGEPSEHVFHELVDEVGSYKDSLNSWQHQGSVNFQQATKIDDGDI